MTDTTSTPTALEAAYAAAAAWDIANPPGSPVLAWPGTRDQEPLRTRTSTRHGAWVLGATGPDPVAVVAVDGYAGGIALTHVDPDPTRRPAVPDIEFQTPPCPICGRDLDVDGSGFYCYTCEAAWNNAGRGGRWDAPDAARCPATHSWANPEIDDSRCMLAAGHADEHQEDGWGWSWTDSHPRAVLDSNGEQVAH